MAYYKVGGGASLDDFVISGSISGGRSRGGSGDGDVYLSVKEGMTITVKRTNTTGSLTTQFSGTTSYSFSNDGSYTFPSDGTVHINAHVYLAQESNSGYQTGTFTIAY
jgi:hypothetical protein